MTTPHRTLQMALDALDAITDDVDGTGLNTMPSFDKAIDAIAALREALAQPAPERWMPIETAPKDVTILLYGAKRLEMCVGMHHSRDGWVTDTTSEWMSMYPPTHWMPLPAAPDHLRDTTEKAAPAAPVVPLTDERITKALRHAFSLGQTYCQQADSDSYKQNAKSDETRQKFETLIVETLNGITASPEVPK